MIGYLPVRCFQSEHFAAFDTKLVRLLVRISRYGIRSLSVRHRRARITKEVAQAKRKTPRDWSREGFMKQTLI